MSETPSAIITGAGSGIGRATALVLASKGWRCALIGRRRDRLQETADQIPSGSSLIVDADVSDPGVPEVVVRTVVDAWGPSISSLINNAAVLLTSPIEDATDEDLQRSFEVNVFAPCRLVRHAWPHMVRATADREGRSRVVNVSSAATRDPFPGLGVYGMSKSALEGLTRSINSEGHRHGIIGLSVVLGAVETEMLRSFVPESILPRSTTQNPEQVGRIIADCAMGKHDAECRSAVVLM